MCTLCQQRMLKTRGGSRRDFLKGAVATAGVAATGINLFAPRPASAQMANAAKAPEDSGRSGRRYVIRGGAVMSMDPRVGDFPVADVLVQGKTFSPSDRTWGGRCEVIDARGRIVMPGFIDTHHHQFETALRSFLADGVLINDGSARRAGPRLTSNTFCRSSRPCTGRRMSTSTNSSAR